MRIEGNTMSSPPPANDAPKTWRPFAAGIGVGTAASAVLWIVAFNAPSNTWLHVVIGLACVLVPATKFLVAATLMSRPDSKLFGAGLLASLGTGFVILAGTCAASLIHAQP